MPHHHAGADVADEDAGLHGGAKRRQGDGGGVAVGIAGGGGTVRGSREGDDILTPPTLVVLCGGQGTRLGSLTKDRPKSMVEVLGRPFIEWQMELVVAQGIKRVMACVGRGGDLIRWRIGNGEEWGVEVRYHADSKEGGDGTGKALCRALHYGGEWISDPFLVMYGDSYLDGVWWLEVSASLGKDAMGRMTAWRSSGGGGGNMCLMGGIVESYGVAGAKPMTHVDYGLTVLRKMAVKIKSYPQKAVRDLGGIYNQWAIAGKLEAHEVQEKFHEMGSLAGLAEMASYLAKKDTATVGMARTS